MLLEALGAFKQLAAHRAGELLGAVRIQLVIPQPVDGETSEKVSNMVPKPYVVQHTGGNSASDSYS